VLDGVTYRRAKGEQENLCNRKKGSPEDDIADGPPVFQRTEDEDQLRDDVDDCASQRPENVYYPQAQRLGVLEPYKAFEGGDGDEEPDPKDREATNPQKLRPEVVSVSISYHDAME